MNPITRDLSAASDELAALAGLGADVETYGVGNPDAIARARTAASFALAAAAESMRDAGMLSAATIARMGFIVLAGMRSPAQLVADSVWCRELAVAYSAPVVSTLRAA